MKIAGVWSGHDSSFCILEDGKPVVHAEYERYNREKSPQADSIKFLFDRLGNECDDITHFVSVFPRNKMMQHEESFTSAVNISEKNSGKFYFISHHQAHAAHAFFSSNLEDSLVVTMDGGGVEDDQGAETATTLWVGEDKKLHHVQSFPMHKINIGGVWTRITRYVFKLQNGWPLGSQEGSVMAMAAMGDAEKYHDDFYTMLTRDVTPAGFKPPSQPKGAYVPGKDPDHPYLDSWAKIADKSQQDKFDLAAGLQSATERLIKELLSYALGICDKRNLSLAGGVTLNSVAMGKIKEWFPDRVDEVYIPPVPYDGGLTLGAAQYVWHNVLDNNRVDWNHNFPPYLGECWKEPGLETVLNDLAIVDKVKIKAANDKDVIQLLLQGKIVSVFNEGSESGRRALGNRSILADPRNSDMKDHVNKKVKHRQWYRPFAPSILQEEVSDWFVTEQESPYMQFVLKFKPEKTQYVPAVVHFDGTARLQTVRETDNSWYYNFLKLWYKKSGVPIILNTSFNDREPICETPQHAIQCFLKTDIDALYFVEHATLLVKK